MCQVTNVFRIESVIESEKLSVHGSITIESVVKLMISYIYNLYFIKIKLIFLKL